MAQPPSRIPIYLEVGKKLTMAGALEWPGWCRRGRDEAAALAALADYGPRYAAIVAQTSLGFTSPSDASAFDVTERLPGTGTTDFGVPAVAPTQDRDPFRESERERSEAILEAIWRALDRAVDSAAGHTLRKGPRGGGRDRESIVRHVLGADAGYLRSLGQSFRQNDAAPLSDELERTRAAIRAALVAAVHAELPERGPRGGTRWPPRYFVRRVSWHALDHVWEIEDRMQ